MGRVLITDDNPFFRSSFRVALTSQFPDIVVDEAANACEAMERIDSQTPDLVFMDLHLPEVNGFELTRRIKARHPQISVAVFTGFDSSDYEHAVLASGANHFLVKSSLTVDGIAALVQKVLSEKGIPI